MKAPDLVEFEGRTKRVVPESLSIVQNKALNYAFPRFYEERNICNDQHTASKILSDASLPVAFDTKLRRRYSGYQLFPRGRYYTLCRGYSTSDGGALVRELVAYHDASDVGIVLTYDLQEEDHLEFVRNYFEAEEPLDALVLIFMGMPGLPNRFISWLEQSEFWESPSKSQSVGKIIIPIRVDYEIVHHKIRRCLDLRQIDHQEWILHTVLSGGLGNVIALPPGARTFLDLLPYLMDGALGGNRLTDAIGRYCRRCEVDALIFPSARCNCAVSYHEDRVIDYYGWNLIDFRGAPLPPATNVDLEGPGRSAASPRQHERGAGKGWKCYDIEEMGERALNVARLALYSSGQA